MGNVTNWLRVYLLGLLSLAVPAFSAELEPVTIRDFSAGLITNVDSSIIPNGAAQDLENVDVEDGSLRKRRGTIKANATPLGGFTTQAVRFAHEYVSPSGLFFLVTLSSNTLFYSQDGGTTNTAGPTDIPDNVRLQGTNAFSKAYLVLGTTWTRTFDGSSFAVSTSPPLGTEIEFFAGRLWIASGSTLYASRVSSDTDWTDDGVDDADAAAYIVRQNDGSDISALVRFGPDLLVFKTNSIDRIVLNNDGLNFSLVPVTSILGTRFPDTVKATDNDVKWLSPDGVYSYDGATIRRVSDAIQGSLAGLPQLIGNSRLYQETTQSEFSVGTTTGVSSSVSPDELVLSTWGVVHTSSADWSGGTFDNVSTTTLDGSLLFTAHYGDTFDATSSMWYRNTYPNAAAKMVVPTAGTFSYLRWVTRNTSGSLALAVYTNSAGSPGVLIASATTTTTLLGSYFKEHTSTVNIAVAAGTYWLVLIGDGPTITTQLDGFDGDTVLVSTSLAGPWVAPNLSDGYVSSDKTYYSFRQSISSGSYTSAALDTSITTPILQASTPTYTLNGSSVAFYTSASTNGVTFDAYTAWTPGSAPTSAFKRYVKYRIVFSTTSGGSGSPYVSDVTLAARASTGRYLSRAVNASDATSWLPFLSNSSASGGTVSFEVYTDTDTTMPFVSGLPTQFISSQTISSGNTPTVSTSTYVRFAATMTVTAAGQAPSVQDMRLQWSEGDTAVFPVSLFWDQAFYLALAVETTDQNDTLFVYDKNGAWTKYTGLPIGVLSLYRTYPYAGLADDGYIIRLNVEDRFRDYNDAAITSFWVSKDFDLGYPATTKSLLRYYVTGPQLSAGSVTFQYGVERGTLTGTTYDMNQTGFFRKIIKPTSLTYSEGIQHRFRIYESTLDAPMTIHSVTGRWNLNTNP